MAGLPWPEEDRRLVDVCVDTVRAGQVTPPASMIARVALKRCIRSAKRPQVLDFHPSRAPPIDQIRRPFSPLKRLASLSSADHNLRTAWG